MRDFLEFFLRILSLKDLRRTGWMHIGIPEAESVASHSFGVAMIAMVLGDRLRSKGVEVDVDKAIRMALLHDILESYVGDIPGPVTKEGIVKVDEIKAFEKVVEPLPPEMKEEYKKLFEEFIRCETIEAKLAKTADKLDQALQAYYYYKHYPLEILKKFANVNAPLGDELKKLIMELFGERYGSRIYNDNRTTRLSRDCN